MAINTFLQFLLLVFIMVSTTTSAFFIPKVNEKRILSSSQLNMMFGAKKASKVVINVDGKTIECEGAVNLRKELLANKIDVYPFKAKITGNCGGAGICGTCAVKVIDGAKNLNPPSKNELNTLRDKPADQRLSCCAKVNGPITIKTKP